MSLQVSRRKFGIAALAASQLKDVQLTAAPEKYTGPLDNYENKVNLEQFDPVGWTRQLHASAPLKLTLATRLCSRPRSPSAAHQPRPH